MPTKLVALALSAIFVLGGQPGALSDKKELPKPPAAAAERPSAEQTATGSRPPSAAQTLPDAVLTLPEGSSIKVRWLCAPLDKDVVAKTSPSNLQLAIDFDGTPWIGYDWRHLVNPVKMLHVEVPVQYSWMACTASGALLLATETDYGFVVPPDRPEKSEGGARAVYQPAANLPASGSRMVGGVGDCLYFIADRPNGGSDVFVQAPKQLSFGGFVRVFTSDTRVTAVTGDGRTTFVALEGLVVKVVLPDGSVNKVYSHHGQHFDQLAWLPGTGLFYNTGTSIGFIGERGADYLLMHLPGARIALHDDVLYVLHKDTLGIFVLENLSDLRRFDKPVQQVPLTDLGVKVQSVRFFKAQEQLSDLPPVEKLTFVDRLDRGAERSAFVYCLVDIDNLQQHEHGRSHLLSIQLYHTGLNRLVWHDTQVVRIDPDSGGLWVWPCVGQVGSFYSGEYVAKAYLDGTLVGESKLSVAGPVPLMWATALDDATRAKQAIAAGEDVNAKDEYGRTPLMLAIEYASPDMVKLLLDAGADPNARDKDGQPVLMKAVREGDVRKIKHLLDAGADVNARDKDNQTALHKVIYVDYFNRATPEQIGAIVKLLVAHRADVEAVDEDGYRPLRLAVLHGCVGAVKALVDNGADVNAADEEGWTPLDRAVLRCQFGTDPQELVRYQQIAWTLQSKGARLSHYSGQYFPGMEQILDAGNLLAVLASSEENARSFLPDDPNLRRLGIAALLQLAQKRASEQNIMQAISLCEEAARRAQRWGMKPEYAEALFDDGLLRLAQGDALVAQYFFQECIKADPKGAAARQARDLVKRLQGR